MSVQGLQRTQQLLNVIGQQLPSIAEASETHGISIRGFMVGTLTRSGVTVTPDVNEVVVALAALIGPSTENNTSG